MRSAVQNMGRKVYCLFALLGSLLVTACGPAYQYDADGIYGSGNRASEQPRVTESTTNNPSNEYESYFATQSSQIAQARNYINAQNQADVFTDPDSYYSADDYAADHQNQEYYTGNEYTETYPSWGSNPATVNINYYGSSFYNPYVYRPYYPYYGSYYPFYSSYYYPYYSSWYRPWFGVGFGFGYAGFYNGFYRPYYGYGYYPYAYYGGYYSNPYYAYSQPSYHSGSRNYRSSTANRSNAANAAARRNAATGNRSATGANSRRVINNSGVNTRSSAPSVNSRRVINNPSGINAGGSRRTINSSGNRGAIQSRPATRRSAPAPTQPRVNSAPTRSSAPAVRSSNSRSSSSFGSPSSNSSSRSTGGSRRR